MQVLGRNLEGLVSDPQEQRTAWKDSHVSVEHLMPACLGLFMGLLPELG